MIAPRRCRQRAFDYLESNLPNVETTHGLLHSSLALSMHALDDFEPADVDSKLQKFADQIIDRSSSGTFRSRLAHLHSVLFDEAGFTGVTSNYYMPLNSYIPAVVERRAGIPISLCLIYKVVAERVGLQVEGVGAPGHFLVRVLGEEDSLLVDPFFGGRVLSVDEACERIHSNWGIATSRDVLASESTTHLDWLYRMVRNLKHCMLAGNWQFDLGAVLELQALLDSYEQN